MFIVFKAILSVSFSVFNNTDYEMILIVIITLFSFILFSHFSFNIYYNNIIVAKIITSLHASITWGSLMLILAKITDEYSFDAATFIYLSGFPFIIFIVMARVE